MGLKENVIIGRLIPVTEDLINKYYSQFQSTYANDKSAGEEKQVEETKEVGLDGAQNKL